ncbi:MAG: DNA-3-methyladenine glycosylase I [Gammaproteobacteria bacterium]|nr:DNA-3-methyladenine glycosylase I [Gammaproteobacteria bacterium]
MSDAAVLGLTRCAWATPQRPEELLYHDTEWGVPVRDDRVHFEFLVLESAQAGLSWYSILRRRAAYRRAFAAFDPVQVAGYPASAVDALLHDEGIIRNRAKITAAINNAARLLEVQQAFGSFNTYVWGFVGGGPLHIPRTNWADVPATSPESIALARDLKARGFQFLGPTTLYAYLQATGLVNDHLQSCFRYPQVAALG